MAVERVAAISPLFGLRVVDRDDLRPKGFEPRELNAVYADLAGSARDYDMLMESASFDEVDEYYNPGLEEVSRDFILEAIMVDRFSKTERRMAAVVRVLNRHLSNSEIKAMVPLVGRPRKTGGYAYVTVQLPFSDGQTVSIIFHSPEGDKKKIAPGDTIIAFRWLLNRRDITHVVAPEDGAEVSLEAVAKRITQLVLKNSARFERTQKEASAERKLLEDTRRAVDDAEDKQRELMDNIAALSKESETVDARLSNTLALLQKQKVINAELQAKIDALNKARAVSSVRAAETARQAAGTSSAGSGVNYAPVTETPEAENPLSADIPEPTAAQPSPATETEAEPAFVSTLREILAGRHDGDTQRVGDLLDSAATDAETAGFMAEYEELFDEAADHLTGLLKRRAAA